MNVVIVLVLTLAGAAVGFFVGGSMVDSSPEPASVSPSSRTPADSDQALADSLKAFSAGADVMARRQRQSMIGAAIGGGIGLLGGIALASRKKSHR